VSLSPDRAALSLDSAALSNGRETLPLGRDTLPLGRDILSAGRGALFLDYLSEIQRDSSLPKAFSSMFSGYSGFA
jgi:hypothetical protein